MFDGAIHPDTAEGDRANLDAILERYDTLMDDPAGITPEDATDLNALAGIFDLDTARPPQDLWPDVRAVLTAQSPRVVEEPVPADEADALTVLVVEDDPEMAQDLPVLLVEAGHDVVGPFHSAEAAEVAAGLHAIDVALLDINLSGPVDGGTLGRGLKTRWGLKVIFLSGDVAAARHADIAETMIIKPYRGADVLGALRRVPGDNSV
ncbi:response regulator [Brevundimonas sp.]|uniref:response regulator n=1 Tax=Brevundimonas sp. TaxID=1871086 RepID=UPI00286BF5BB|nr:response regulator [Brevundimonas sp.]